MSAQSDEIALKYLAKECMNAEYRATAECPCDNHFWLMHYPMVGVCKSCGAPAYSVMTRDEQQLALAVVGAFR